ncbi:hypothetical protein H696_05247 [Fonticula alba]|uniref:Major facilitator superfamily (MFS) profile domain-containing protein n=1 Tax=Fonticula alba TaxID=691883 RepID=A0A058Z234_FONAL|nr:hypothetical protein H696_05247 [Fonticula alba]KCV68330.1 hypothetical protein H696_05247 [Fonticula alba]|eukprot:XP_009497384.1 hypothetical protein H696_05247 [Fonticula alba]
MTATTRQSTTPGFDDQMESSSLLKPATTLSGNQHPISGVNSDAMPMLSKSGGGGGTISTGPNALDSDTAMQVLEDEDVGLDIPAPRPSMALKILYGMPQLGTFFSNTLLNQWLTYYYLPPGEPQRISASVFGVLLVLGRLANAFCDPPVGYLSDRSRLRLGRRIPFMLFGAPFLAIFFSSLWFPPYPGNNSLHPGQTQNAVYFTFMFMLYNVAFAFVTAPWTALSPEITREKSDRVMLATFSGLFSLAGNLLGAMIGPFQANHQDGLNFLGIQFASGLQFCGAMAGLLLLVCFWVPLLVIKENPNAPRPPPHNIVKELIVTVKNPAFRSLIGITSFLPMGVVFVGTGLPYLCTQILEAAPNDPDPGLVKPGTGESWTGLIAGIMIAGALLCMPFVGPLAQRFGKKIVMLFSTILMALLVFSISFVKFFPDPAIPTLIGVAIMAIPASVSFILPSAIYGDVVDFDSRRSGQRREGIYAGANAFSNKIFMAIGSAAIVYILELGATRADPIGIVVLYSVAGLVMALGALLFSTHPIRD